MLLKIVRDWRDAHLDVLLVLLCVRGHIVDDIVLEEEQCAYNPLCIAFLIHENGQVALSVVEDESVGRVVVKVIRGLAVGNVEFHTSII